MGYIIVTGEKVIPYIKTCKYFNVSLGFVSTIEGQGGNRVMNNKDTFSYFYNSNYRTTIYAKGNIGDIRVYSDLYIRDMKIAFYYGSDSTFEEFVYDFDLDLYKQKGIENYLGYFLKRIEEEHEDRIKKAELKKAEPVPVGDADAITLNPGMVSYADVKAYLERERKNRYKNI